MCTVAVYCNRVLLMAAFADRSSHLMLAQVYSPVVDVNSIIHNVAHAQVSLASEESRDISAKAKVRQDSRLEKGGKRWARRRDNCEQQISRPSVRRQRSDGTSLGQPSLPETHI